jgi:hypothetical protein
MICTLPDLKRAASRAVAVALLVSGFAAPSFAAPTAPRQVERNRLFFAGDATDTRFASALRLDDGDLLVAGSTASLDWTSPAPRRLLVAPVGAPHVGGGSRIALLLRLSPDLRQIRMVYHFAPGALDEISRLRGTGAPGAPLGEIYASGRYPKLTGENDGYWITRLPPLESPASPDAATAASAPAQLPWLHFVSAPATHVPKDGSPAEGDYARRQPWDVRSDGRVIYAEGAPYSQKWAALRILEADGRTGALPGWIVENGSCYLPLKPGRVGSLRSRTQADFDHRQEDENDNPGRKGRYPDDYYFTGPEDQRGRGYTGYRAVGTTQRVSPLVIDRRDNSLYFGTSTQTRLPDGNPDFEPAFVRLDSDGRLVWWARGYKEVERIGDQKTTHQDAINSPPDQYVDQVALDPVNNRILFVARAHGGGVINFWRASTLVRNRGRTGFLDQLHNSGNVHVSWLGAYGIADGKIHRATWIAELAEGARNLGRPLPSGLLAGWPRPNEGWTNQTTTRVEHLEVDAQGRPLVLAIGRRPYTTSNALIENVKPSEGRSAWAHFARLYDADLARLDYSTLLRGPWDRETGKGGEDESRPRHLLPLPGGFLVVGEHRAAPPGAASRPPAALQAPDWGSDRPTGRVASGLIFFLRLDDADEEADGPAPHDMGSRARSLY